MNEDVEFHIEKAELLRKAHEDLRLRITALVDHAVFGAEESDNDDGTITTKYTLQASGRQMTELTVATDVLSERHRELGDIVAVHTDASNLTANYGGLIELRPEEFVTKIVFATRKKA